MTTIICTVQFLSTLSLRRATHWQTKRRLKSLFLSTLSLRRATLSFYAQNRHLTFLSTLSLRRATQHCNNLPIKYVFLSTLSLRRATEVIAVMTEAQSISIHALLAESDWLQLFLYYQDNNFYPRSPCGERPRTQSQSLSAK